MLLSGLCATVTGCRALLAMLRGLQHATCYRKLICCRTMLALLMLAAASPRVTTVDGTITVLLLAASASGSEHIAVAAVPPGCLKHRCTCLCRRCCWFFDCSSQLVIFPGSAPSLKPKIAKPSGLNP